MRASAFFTVFPTVARGDFLHRGAKRSNGEGGVQAGCWLMSVWDERVFVRWRLKPHVVSR